MPITKSAKKALRGSARKRAVNLRRKDTLKGAIKDARADRSKESLSKAYQAIDKAVKGGLIKKNTAARKKSRLVKAFKKAK
ncbi:MAG: 30S ribosomal protein S20 [Patescibacteria group bacterium]